MNQQAVQKNENVLAGIVGAFLFSLAGAAVWVVLSMVGFFSAIAGVVGAVCAMQGYRIFAGRLSRKGVIIAAVIAILVLALAWYCCFAFDLFQAYKGWVEQGEVEEMPTYFDCVRGGWVYLSDPEIARAYFIDLAIGLALALLGSMRYFINAFKAAGQELKEEQAAANGAPADYNYVQTSYTPPQQNTDGQLTGSDPYGGSGGQDDQSSQSKDV